jgi:tetratricopeptide (TPR) repeat protein
VATYPVYAGAVRTGFLACLIAANCLAIPSAVAEDRESALRRAREAANNQQYADVIEILTPFNSIDDPEWRYVSAAEIGRAYFHLARYHEAHNAFREAVRLHPERVESAIYLEATSFLVGDRKQALLIFEEILKSGARDLYMAVTLPGERRFLADPGVRAILADHVIPLDIDVESASVLGASLGDSRDRVEALLEAETSDRSATSLTASAGPAFIWGFVFDQDQRLGEIVLQTENLFKYTPYRVRLGDGVDWSATPAAVLAAWGPPETTFDTPDHGLAMTWKWPKHRSTLEFASRQKPRPAEFAEGAAMLKAIILSGLPAMSDSAE